MYSLACKGKDLKKYYALPRLISYCFMPEAR